MGYVAQALQLHLYCKLCESFSTDPVPCLGCPQLILGSVHGTAKLPKVHTALQACSLYAQVANASMLSLSVCVKGTVAAKAGDLMEARSHFMDAVSLEADCAEAVYNLGLVSKALGNLDDALTAFKKMNSMLTDDTAAMFQVNGQEVGGKKPWEGGGGVVSEKSPRKMHGCNAPLSLK